VGEEDKIQRALEAKFPDASEAPTEVININMNQNMIMQSFMPKSKKIKCASIKLICMMFCYPVSRILNVFVNLYYCLLSFLY